MRDSVVLYSTRGLTLRGIGANKTLVDFETQHWCPCLSVCVSLSLGVCLSVCVCLALSRAQCCSRRFGWIWWTTWLRTWETLNTAKENLTAHLECSCGRLLTPRRAQDAARLCSWLPRCGGGERGRDGGEGRREKAFVITRWLCSGMKKKKHGKREITWGVFLVFFSFF